MSAQDTWCTVGAYFKVKPGKMAALDNLAQQFVDATSKEPGMQYYGWSFDKDEAHCGHVYNNAEGLLEHAGNVGHLFMEAAKISDARLTIQGPEEELAKLRGPLAPFNPQFFVRKYGFRR